MQGEDTDRIKIDDKCWHVKCLNCDTWFYATRSDATYCSGRCRTFYSRRQERKLAAIADLQAMGRRANQIAATYPHSTDMFDQMALLKTAIDRALQTFELKREPLQLPE